MSKTSPSPRSLPPRDAKSGRPPRKLSERLREHIFETAFNEFVEHGYDGASMDGIAAASGVSKRTLYAHCGSKEGLLTAAMQHVTTDSFDPILANLPEGTLGERLVYLAAVVLDVSLSKRAIGAGILLKQIEAHHPDLVPLTPGRAAAPLIDLIYSLLEEVTPRDDLPTEDLWFRACFLFDALITSPRLRILERHDLEDTPEAREAHIRKTLDFLAPTLPSLSARSTLVPKFKGIAR